MNNKDLDLTKVKSKRDMFLLWLGIAAAATGLVDAFANNSKLPIDIISIAISIVAIIIIYCWVIYDAKLRNYRIPKYIKYIVILFSIIGVPIYFWQTRSFKDFCLNFAGLWLFIYHYFIYYLGVVITTFFLTRTGYY